MINAATGKKQMFIPEMVKTYSSILYLFVVFYKGFHKKENGYCIKFRNL